MLKSIGRQSGESVQSVLEKEGKAMVERIEGVVYANIRRFAPNVGYQLTIEKRT